MIRPILLSLLLLPAAHAADIVIAFHCPDKSVIHAVFQDQSTLKLTLPDGTRLTLKQARSASGARYTHGPWEAWNKGDSLRVSKNDKLLLDNCLAR